MYDNVKFDCGAQSIFYTPHRREHSPKSHAINGNGVISYKFGKVLKVIQIYKCRHLGYLDIIT